MSLITIVTPTYNRARTLPVLYESLCRQSSKNFKWLIVDDGSTDDTENLVRTFDTANFEIKYIRKDNGGKHTALNLAFDILDTELTFIVDSDDWLTVDAIRTIEEDWSGCGNMNICGISYLRGYNEAEVIGDVFPQDNVIDNFITLRFNKRIGGDKAEVWRTDLLKQFRYPVFDGEKFFGESYIWVKISERNDMLFRNKILYITEYLEGGLSKSGRAMRIQCPNGGMTNAELMMSDRFALVQRIKGALLYIAYAWFAKQGIKRMLKTPHFLLKLLSFPAGTMIYLKWRRLLHRK